ncbi:CHAP domain-containing protein [Enterococcus raffinosus]|uniref:glucosaminidase domain-containing protein n=1 Tax=Enterococcus raffinosus TaxID=71452 RepID=UPI001C10C2E7|nr:glucosaminidase domain-containing protein [Enterococcus raffinosus]MBU5362681.1 CHAP domain-containing protein [Enterococcus raffinosus]
MKKSIWKICAACLSILLLTNTFSQTLQAAEELTSDTTIHSTEDSAINKKTSAENSVTSSEQLQESATVPSESAAESSSISSSSSTASENTTTSSEQSASSTTESSSGQDSSETSTVPSSTKPTASSTTSKPSTSTTPSKEQSAPSTSKETSVGSTQASQENNGNHIIAGKQTNSVLATQSASTVGTGNTAATATQTAAALSQLDEVSLDESLRVSDVSESDLKGFELPLLTAFEDKSKAVLVYEGIRQVGRYQVTTAEADKTGQTFKNTEELLNLITKNLFGESAATAQKASIANEKKQPGDLLYKDDQLFGLYLGGDHYLVAGDPSDKEKTENPEQADHKIGKIALFSDQKDLEQSLQVQRLNNSALTTYGKEVEKAYPASMDFTENEQTQAFIETIAKSAQKLGLDYDVFASVMIAQAILESGSGTSSLAAAPNYNLFGVKGSYEGASVNFSTQEDRGSGEMYTIQAAFRRYPSYAESLGDYVTLIRGGIQGNEEYYQDVWRSQAKNYLRSASALTGKYATDTSYNRKISSLIAVYHLTQYDLPIPENKVTGTQTSAVMQGKETIPAAYREKMTFPDYDGKNYNLSGSYPVGQCTWYAYNRVAQLGKRVDDYMGNGGEWGTSAKRLGYQTSQTPKAGWLISFSPGTAGSDPRYGHVAFVEAVTDEGILISEGNVVGGTIISYRIIPNSLARSQLVTYIEAK